MFPAGLAEKKRLSCVIIKERKSSSLAIIFLGTKGKEYFCEKHPAWAQFQLFKILNIIK
jgi:hypothetical protein